MVAIVILGDIGEISKFKGVEMTVTKVDKYNPCYFKMQALIVFNKLIGVKIN